MLLENLTESQLDEVFNAEEIGTVYPVVDLTPKAKVPQMLHMQVPGTNDLIVRLTHLDTVGTRVKAVQPGDKTVQVFLMSLSEKGNITDFRGGLGSDPVGAINTIFTTVFEIAKKFRFEAVLFRFVKTSMKGQSQAVTRILTRLINQRSGGRFNALEEVTRAESGKFNFVMAVKKNSGVLEDVKPEPEFKKIETKVGEAFVNTETGAQASKAEVVADAIVKKAAKISTKTVIAKTKISKQALMSALYGQRMSGATYKPDQFEKWKEVTANATVHASKGAPELPEIQDAAKRISSSLNQGVMPFWRLGRALPAQLVAHPGPHIASEIMETMMDSGYTKEEAADFAVYLGRASSNIVYASQNKRAPLGFQEYAEAVVADAMKNPKFSALPVEDRLEILEPFLGGMTETFGEAVSNYLATINVGELSSEQRYAIREYAFESYGPINEFLLGLRSTPKIDKIVKNIELIDSAFAEHGFKLPKWAKLYRGQLLNIGDAVKAIEHKMFYFRNFVSTSMKPIIYEESQFNKEGNLASTVGVGMSQTWDDMNAKDLVASVGKVRDKTVAMLQGKDNVQISYIISGADKVKVLIPGPLAQYTEEAEVILPRGTVLKFDKITGGDTTSHDTWDEDNTYNALLVEASVADPKILTEDVVYDGDIFMESGELVPMYFDQEPQTQEVTAKPSFSDMFDNQYKPTTEVDKMLNLYAATCFDSMPDRFK